MRIALSHPASNRLQTFLSYVALALIVFGARLWLISNYGSSMPIHDQWDGEARTLFKPFLEGTLRFADLFEPHNEHRILPSRLLALGLLLLNGQWDSLVEMTANAGLCALIGVIVSATVLHSFRGRHRTAIITAVTLWLALPFAHENTLWAFQSCFYFLLLFSWLAIWGLGFHDPFHRTWWLGVAALIFACLSMASGFLAALVILILIATRLIKRTISFRQSGATIVLCATSVALAYYFRVPVPAHEALKASSITAWLNHLSKCISWPFYNASLACLIVYAPLGMLAAIYLFSREWIEESRHQAIELICGVAVWSLLQAAAIAYARAGDSSVVVPSRYMDILALGPLANFFGLLVLIECFRTRLARGSVILAAFVFVIVVVAAAIHISPNTDNNMRFRQGYLEECERRIAAYLVTGDRQLIISGGKTIIPHPRGEEVLALLDQPSIRSILPARASKPLHIENVLQGDDAFVLNGYPANFQTSMPERGWGSFSERESVAHRSMRSQVIRPRLPYLRFEFAGYFTKEMSFTLEGTQHGKNTPIRLPRRADGWWHPVYIAVNESQVRINVKDDDPAKWVAFREPQELGRYSFYSLWLLNHGRMIFIYGIAFWAILAFNEVRTLLLVVAGRSAS